MARKPKSLLARVMTGGLELELDAVSLRTRAHWLFHEYLSWLRCYHPDHIACERCDPRARIYYCGACCQTLDGYAVRWDARVYGYRCPDCGGLL